jgi:hypothetical protein
MVLDRRRQTGLDRHDHRLASNASTSAARIIPAIKMMKVSLSPPKASI